MVLATTSTLVCPCGRVGSGIVTEPHHASDGYFVHVCVELRLSVVVDPFEGIDRRGMDSQGEPIVEA